MFSPASVHENHLSNSTDLSAIELDDELGKMELEDFLGSAEPSSIHSDEEKMNELLEAEFDPVCDEEVGNNNCEGGLDDDALKNCPLQEEHVTNEERPHPVCALTLEAQTS